MRINAKERRDIQPQILTILTLPNLLGLDEIPFYPFACWDRMFYLKLANFGSCGHVSGLSFA